MLWPLKPDLIIDKKMKKKEKHLPYHNLLSALREARKCVFCELESKYLRHYLDHLLYVYIQ